MGEVDRARDPRLGRDGATKVLPLLSGDPQRQARFHREMRAVPVLSHTIIPGVFDAGKEHGSNYAFTKLLGETLRPGLRSGGLASRKAVELAMALDRVYFGIALCILAGTGTNYLFKKVERSVTAWKP